MTEEEEAALARDIKMIGQVYDINMAEQALKEPVTVKLQYSPGDIPEGFSEENLFITHYHNGTWEILKSEVDVDTKTVSAEVSEFSGFGLLVIGGLTLISVLLIMTSTVPTIKALQKLGAKQKFEAMKAKYLTNYSKWTSEELGSARAQLKALAAKAKIDFNPDSLPAMWWQDTDGDTDESSRSGVGPCTCP